MDGMLSNLLDSASMHPASIKRIKKNYKKPDDFYEKNYYAKGLVDVTRKAFRSSRSVFPIKSEWNKIVGLSYEDLKERNATYTIYYAPFCSSSIKTDVCTTPRELEKKVINHYHYGDLILMVDMEVF